MIHLLVFIIVFHKINFIESVVMMESYFIKIVYAVFSQILYQQGDNVFKNYARSLFILFISELIY